MAIAMAELDEQTIQQFAAGLRGRVLRPADEGYDAARRVWNGMIDRAPALIARCAGVADVISAVNFARSHQLLVSVRGGGHNVTGNAVCDGGLMIDLTPMKGIQVDPEGRTVRAQAGVTWGEFDHETQAFGLATTGGQVSTTGIAGLTLGGGIGWLMRKCGAVVDNLLSVDLVTAEGRFLTASATENAELFWGLRGGGGNFGIATSFTYRLHPIGPIITGGMLLYPASEAAALLRFYRAYMAAASDDVLALISFLSAPPAPFVPAALHGAPMVAVGFCHAGPLDEGGQAADRLRAFGPPIVDLIGPMPYTALQQLFDPSVPFGMQVYLKSDHLPHLDDQVVETLVTHAAGRTSPHSVVLVLPFGGAIGRAPDTSTAFGHRDAAFDYVIYSMWTAPHESERHVAWTRTFAAAMQPFSLGVYVNEMANDEGAERVRAAYPPATYQRLAALKKTYDPTNMFRLNQNILPAP